VNDLTYASASTLARDVREKRISAREVVEAHLRRIESINPQLNAVAQLTAETAMNEAFAADEALARGETAGPLHGVPFTVKDWIETAGVVCAAGKLERKEFVPRRDATVVARMREVGAIMLAKTIDGHDNEVYGHPNNPYDLARTPGGSSSGEAALIAAGGSPLGLGSDSGGSIRFPAHCCGIAGLKPTNGRVPLTGHFPRINAMSDPRTQIGPMARCVEDLALVLPVIAGPDWRDAGVVPMPLEDWKAVGVRGLRVATFTEFPGASASSDVVAAVRGAAGALSAFGAGVEEATPPRIEESLEITRKYWRRVESYSWQQWSPDRGEHSLTPEETERSIFEWDRLRRDFLGFMRRFDLIVCPVAGAVAGFRAASDEEFIYTLPFSLTGYPCVTVRAGASSEGLPIGVQVVATPWRDDVALAASYVIERALGGWHPPAI
jgi:amidase